MHDTVAKDASGRLRRQESAQQNGNDGAEQVDDKPEKNCWPDTAGTSAFQRWTYSYMNPIIQKGCRQFRDGVHLIQDDLFDVPPSMESRYLLDRFRKIYHQGEGRLIPALWKLAAPTFVPAGLCQLVVVISKVSLPMSMRQLLLTLGEHSENEIVLDGLPYAFAIFGAALFIAFAQHREAHLATQTGIILRSALVSAIYKHSLDLTPEGRSGLTTGEVTNLVAVDTQKLFEVTLEGHLFWGCPLYVIIVMILLWVVMGPTTLVGVFVLVMFVPIVQQIVKAMIKTRKQRTKLTDHRINMLTSMLQGIRVTKLNNYEQQILNRVNAVRQQEMKLVRSELWAWAWTMVSAVISPLLATAATFTVYVLSSEDNILTSADTFSVLLLFAILRFPINLTARLAGKMAQAFDAARRISAFLDRETRLEENSVDATKQPESNSVLKVRDASFAVGEHHAQESNGLPKLQVATSIEAHQPTFEVSNVSLDLKHGQVWAVVGPIGSGKSTLVQGLLGELPPKPGTHVSVKGTMGYASQVPFILNATLRENILFGSEFDEDRYNRTLDACCLVADLAQLGDAGDLTEIGERGVTLSGGQKQRVSLARVAYACPDVAILDDPFCALDSNTATRAFQELFDVGRGGLLRSSGTIVVTHAVHFLNQVDQILVLSNGKPEFVGSWNNLQESDVTKSGIMKSIQSATQDKSAGGDAIEDDPQLESSRMYAEALFNEEEGVIMTIEEREYGLSSFEVWLVWFQHAGGWTYLLLQILFLCIDRGSYVASELWIAKWAAANDGPIDTPFGEFPPQTDGRKAQLQYLKVYFTVVAISVLGTYLRSHWAVAGGARCAETLFSQMTSSVLGAPMSYFETTPLGRILNRFTFDVEILDIELTVSMAGIMISLSWFVAAVCVMIAVLPWIVVVLVPVLVVYFLLQRRYRMSGPDLQRLDALSRSPLQASLAEALDGSATIRAFQRQRHFVDKFHMSVDHNSSAMLNFLALQRWLGLRIEVLGACISLTACMIVVLANGVLQLGPGIVGLLIIWSINFTVVLGFLFTRFSESEARITAIERIRQTSDLPQEAAMQTDSSRRLDPSWPKHGQLIFDKVCLRYRDGLPLAIDHLSFTLETGTRCGVVGRTGAGKTSLTAALFRLVELESGRILLDGVDLSSIGLSDVRGRPSGMAIIPQDPILFSGSLRKCLDPFGLESDAKIIEALVAVNHRGCERGVAILEDTVDEGGANYSVGERQLICLARAILAQPKVLVLDEATASVDRETDMFIQHMLRARFRETTMLTIAHRLQTIMDYDKVLVMDRGKAVEFDSPAALLELPDGVFASLVDSAGEANASALRALAE